MAGGKSYLALIPARAGSKRLPGKNLKILNGQPLIVHTITAATGCLQIRKTIVSTDSAEILSVALSNGCSPHPLRAADMAQDDTTSPEMLRYEVQRLEAMGERYDFVVLLQPTSPLRISADIGDAIRILEADGADTLTSAYRTSHLRDEVLFQKDGRWVLMPAVDAKDRKSSELYTENGSIFILSWDVLKRGGFYGKKLSVLEMPADRSVDIDTEHDFEIAARYFTNQAT